MATKDTATKKPRTYPVCVILLGILIPCAVVLLLLMGTFEVVLRAQETAGPSLRLITQKSNNSILVYELAPNSSVIANGVLIQTNPEGFRDTRVFSARHPGVQRVVVLGDSATLQNYLPANETWTALLERRLNRSVPVEVINAGVNGYDTRQEAEVLRTKALALAPDLVLIAYTLNDPIPSAGSLLDKYVAEDNVWCKVHSFGITVPCALKDLFFVKLRSVRWLVHQYDALHASYVDVYKEIHVGEQFKTVEDAFATINATIHAGQTTPTVCIVVFPALRYADGYPYTAIDAQLKALAARYGWPAIALSEKIVDANAQCLRQAPNDELHPNFNADVSIALALDPFLRTECLTT